MNKHWTIGAAIAAAALLWGMPGSAAAQAKPKRAPKGSSGVGHRPQGG